MPRLCVLVLLLAAPTLASAQVYRCVDKNGRVQYSQTRPADAQCEGVEAKVQPPAGSDVDGLMKYSKELDKARAEESKAQQQAQQAARQQANRQARCKSARSRQALLAQSGRVFVMDENGDRTYQDDAQRSALQAEAQAVVARECG